MVHGGIRNHKCDFCDYACYQAAGLKRHITCFHEGLSNLQCNICGESFSQPEDFKIHKKIIHEGGLLNNHKCYQCDKTFCNLGNLKRHIESDHEKMKNNKCYLCDRAFSQPHHLKGHIKGEYSMRILSARGRL